MTPRLGALAGNVGKGLAAGLAGTAAMTLSSTLEAKLRHRQPSMTPAEVASTVLRVKPDDERAERRLNTLVHWTYGTASGGLRGVLTSLGLGPVAGTAAHLAAVWGAEQVVLPATDTAPPVNQWGKAEVAVDLFHHAVYAVATGAAFAWLECH